jgi:putative PIG3 family NAD(P)H quinone oxidoreductase
MRAAVIQSFGSPEGLAIRDVPDPEPKAREVVARVRTSALNRADLLQRSGRYPPPPDVPKDIPGIEFAGEVIRLGPDATRWAIGDRVFGVIGGGGHAELVRAHEDTILRVPASLSWDEAAAIPEAYTTAHDALVTQAAMRQGERVLIHAAGSGVGLAATQLVRAWGATAYGTSRTADKIERARPYGLTDGIALAEELDPLSRAVSGWTNGVGVDVVMDLVGGPYVPVSIEVLAPRGRLMLVGAVGGSQVVVDVRRIMARRLTIRGTVLRSRSLEEKADAARGLERDVLPLLAQRVVGAVIDSVFPLEAIADAHRRLESNESFGKVIIAVS